MISNVPLRSLHVRVSAGLPAVLGLAAVLRLAVFLAAARSPQRFWSPDDREYIPIANHLHDSYLASSGRLFDLGLRRPPVYPLFLRAVFEVFGPHYAAVVAIQLVLSVATVALVYWLAQLLLPRTLALLAAFLLAIDPASIVFANQMMTETLFAFLLTLALALTILALRRSEPILAAVAGLVLGVGVLTRPVATYVPLVVVPALVLVSAPRRRRSLIIAAALVLGFAIPAGGWLARNVHTTGVATISTIEGYNMWNYRAVGALVETGQPEWNARQAVKAQLAPHLHPGQNAAEVSREQLRVGVDVLAKHPAGAAKSWARGEFRLLLGPARAETAMLLTGRQAVEGSWLRALVGLNTLVTVLMLLAAAAGVVGLLARRIAVPELWILAAVAVYLVAVSGGPEAYSRFRVPVAPLFAILAAAVLAWRRGSAQADAVSAA
jgi:4-amino-4-deoxy-L-arabinose transferase-like glycosyltransferase